MSQLAQLNALIAQAVELQEVDMTETGTSGGGGLMPDGWALARVVEYIEFGQHPQQYQGKPNGKFADEFKITFKLFGGDYDGRYISTFDLAVSNTAKAQAKKLFDNLNYTSDLQHPAQALGRAYMVKIDVHKNTTTNKESNRLNLGMILPPIEQVSKKPYDVPVVDESELKLFLFNVPTKESWDALFMEGNWDNGDSKNKVQEKILTATNFPGSALEQLLSGVVLPDPAAAVATPAVAPAAVVASAVAAPIVAPAVAPVAPVMPTMPAPSA